MKVLWISDSLFTRTAYALQTQKTLLWVNDKDGIEADLAPLGSRQQGSIPRGEWMPFDIWPASSGSGSSGQAHDASAAVEAFYRGDYDYAVCLKDAQSWTPGFLNNPLPKVLYTPIDNEDPPKALFDRCRHQLRVWAPSQHAVDLLEDEGIPARYVPHHVDATCFEPVETKDTDLTRGDFKQDTGFDPDTFVVGFVGVNRGTRKGIPTLIRAFADFYEDNPDARLHLHTSPMPEGLGGAPIPALLDKHDIPRRHVRWTKGWSRNREGYSPQDMAVYYNSLDVYLGATRGEGFAVPLLEAAACGVPVIGTDYAAARERVTPGENGILVPPSHHRDDMMAREQALPRPSDIAHALQDARDRSWDPAQVRSTVIPEFDVATVIREQVLPALADAKAALKTRIPIGGDAA